MTSPPGDTWNTCTSAMLNNTSPPAPELTESEVWERGSLATAPASVSAQDWR